MNVYNAQNTLILSQGTLGGVPQFPGTAKCMAVSLSPLAGIPGVETLKGLGLWDFLTDETKVRLAEILHT